MSPPNKLTTDYLGRLIYEIRGQRVMLDSDLAAIYGVSTKRLLEQVRRNLDRFPHDFAFQITRKEHEVLRSQFATASQSRTILRSQTALRLFLFFALSPFPLSAFRSLSSTLSTSPRLNF
jgi:hypothetical protein